MSAGYSSSGPPFAACWCKRARPQPPRCTRSKPLAELTRKRDTLLIVDGITAVGVFDLPMDRWGIDVLVTGSQKALMLPPGLAFIALSERAWKRTKEAKLPRFYFDLTKERDNQAKDTTAWTPAISLVIGLRESLAMIHEEGLATDLRPPRPHGGRHARRGRGARACSWWRPTRPVRRSPACTRRPMSTAASSSPTCAIGWASRSPADKIS